MRLHSLTLSAFGPYPGVEAVDFDSLSIDGLFLLHGDTGAGKTTVLDGVAFALFGAVPGARGEVRRLRCDYASPDAHTEVSLEFTVQGSRLRITRSPEYRRPKRRGEGYTTEPAKVAMVWCSAPADGDLPEGLTRADEVGRTVERLLGMSAAQFFQVVLLPQGEFARFLRAETAEREQLLEKLFGTHRFAEIERWFRDHRVGKQRELDGERRAVEGLLARVGQAAGEDPPAGLSTADTRAWLDELSATVSSAARAAADQAAEARRAAQAAEHELRQAREKADRVRRVRLAEADLAAFEAEESLRRRWRDEVAAARRAEPIVVSEGRRARAADLLDHARVAEDAAAVAFDREVDTDSGRESPVPVLRQRARELRDEAGGLRELVAEAAAQATDRDRLDSLAVSQQELADRADTIATELAAMPARVEQARDSLGSARDAAARVDGVAAKLAELESVVADAKALPAAERTVAAAEAAVRAATDAHQERRERLLDVRQRRLDGMAGELAATLRPGEPCSVCGSGDHPAPAVSVDPVTEADERGAADAEQQAQRERSAADDLLRDAGAERQRLLARVNGRALDEVIAERDTTVAQHRQLAASAATVRELADALAELEGHAARMRDAETELARRRSATETEHAELRDRVTARAARLDVAREGYSNVGERRDFLLRLADQLEYLADRRAERVAAENHLGELAAEVVALTAKADFATCGAALAAARTEAEIEAVTERLAEAEQRGAVARSVLADPELADLGDADVDLDSAEQRAATCRTESEHAVVAAKAAEAREADVGALRRRLAAAWAELAPREAEFAELDALTDVVNGRGQNNRKMSLRSFVLAARLQEVATAATWRLRGMSQGRYTFVHSDAAGPRGTRGGLGLDIRDDYSGQVRPTKTLSGGESFLASLSLALGLADVVAAESGGALLDTLFVDEGFGTLDSDTLDVVMDTLDELRAGGRVVGLVSHVEELRQRIPVRLKVRKARSGSTLELTAG